MSSSRAPAPTPTTLLNQKRASPTLIEPSSLVTPPATITKSIASRYSQVHNQQGTDTRVPGTSFQIQVDFKRGLWGFCPSDAQDVGNCWMNGICFDEDKCKDGCGFLDRKDLGIATCSSKNSSGSTIRASICATAYLTLDNNLGPFQYIACGWTTTRTHYTASQADAASNPAVTTTTSSSSSSSSSSGSSSASLSTPPGTPSETSSSSSASTDSSSNDGGGGNSANIGAIVGGVIGGLAIICAFVFAAYLVWAYRVRLDRRRKHDNVSEPLNGGNGNGNGDGNGDGSGRSSSSETYGTPPEMVHVHVRDAAEGGGGGGGWGPRELDSGFERGGYAHEFQQGQSGGHGPYEVLSVEKVVEMPVRMEPVEMSSGWEDHHPGRDGRDGREGGSYGHELLGTEETNGGRRV